MYDGILSLNNDFTANLPHTIYQWKKFRKSVKISQIVATSLWPHFFWPILCVKKVGEKNKRRDKNVHPVLVTAARFTRDELRKMVFIQAYRIIRVIKEYVNTCVTPQRTTNTVAARAIQSFTRATLQ